MSTGIDDLSGVKTNPPFDLGSFLRQNAPLISFMALILTLLGGFWLISTRMQDLSYKQGVIDGEIKIILQDRRDFLIYERATSSAIPLK